MAQLPAWERQQPNYLVELRDGVEAVDVSALPDVLLEYVVEADWMDDSPDKKWQVVRVAAEGLHRVRQSAIDEDAEAIILAKDAERWYVPPPDEWKVFVWKHSEPTNVPYDQEVE